MVISGSSISAERAPLAAGRRRYVRHYDYRSFSRTDGPDRMTGLPDVDPGFVGGAGTATLLLVLGRSLMAGYRALFDDGRADTAALRAETSKLRAEAADDRATYRDELAVLRAEAADDRARHREELAVLRSAHRAEYDDIRAALLMCHQREATWSTERDELIRRLGNVEQRMGRAS